MDMSDLEWSDSDSECDSVGHADRTMGYDAGKKLRLCEALRQCEGGSGDFACGGRAQNLPLPGLFIDGVGPVTLPVLKDQADKIIVVATRASYGPGEQTSSEESCLKSWQIDTTQIQIKNEEFIEAVNELVEDVKAVLGCNEESVTSVLGKVYLYEEGGHFKSVGDTEKENGMFASLIVQMPSIFEGGKLIVRHGGKEKVIEMDGDQTAFSCKYAAHYVDCEHEVTDISSGYRLALVYSLCWTGSGEAPSVTAGLSTAKNLSKILTDFSNDRNGDKFAWFLSHKYVESALALGGMKALKGHDAVVADALIAANKFLSEGDQYELHFAQVTRHIHQFGNRYAWDIDATELFDEIEKIRVAMDWYTMDGCIKQMPKFYLDLEDEVLNFICPTGSRKDRYNVEFWGEPDKEYNTGRTAGKGAATQHYWYKTYAILAWQKKNTLKVMCSAELESVVGQVIKEVKLVKDLDQANMRYQKCMADVKQIILFAATGKLRKDSLEKVICPLLEMLSEIGDVAMSQSFLTDVLGRREFKTFTKYNKATVYGLDNDQMIPRLARLISVLGWTSLASSLSAVFDKCSLSQFRRWTTLVDQLVGKTELAKELIQFRIQLMNCLYLNLGSQSWEEIERPEQRNTLSDLLCMQPWHAEFDGIFKKFVEHKDIKSDLELCCNLIAYLKKNCENNPEVHAYIKSFLGHAVKETEESLKTKKFGSRAAIKAVTDTAQLLFSDGDDALLERFVSAILQGSNENLLTALLRTGISAAVMENNPHWMKLVNTRVQQLEIVEKQGPPSFSWHSWCRDNVETRGPTEVQEFLRGPHEIWTKKGFAGFKEARNWVNMHIRTQDSLYTAKIRGSGKAAHVVFQKTKIFQIVHEVKMTKYQNKMKELSGLRLIGHTCT